MNEEQKLAIKWFVSKQKTFSLGKDVLDYVLDNYGRIELDAIVKSYREDRLVKARATLVKVETEISELTELVKK